jgi:UDPglucose 6-dehydrogenase
MEAGAKVKAFDPVAMEEAHRDLGDSITYAKDEYDAIVDTDALLLVTEWPEFRIPNFNVVSKLLKNKVIFDGRNIYDREVLRSLGYTYYGIGLQ